RAPYLLSIPRHAHSTSLEVYFSEVVALVRLERPLLDEFEDCKKAKNDCARFGARNIAQRACKGAVEPLDDRLHHVLEPHGFLHARLGDGLLGRDEREEAR